MAEILPSQIVQQNLRLVLDQIQQVCQRIQRADIPRLVAVGKTFPASHTLSCYEAGQRHFGENYIQELEGKAEDLKASCPDIKWHFIGKIQSNKINKIAAVPNLWCVETLESQKHAETLQKAIQQQERNLNVFLQVNTSAEPNKGGVEPNSVVDMARFVVEYCPNLEFKGLMTIGSITESTKNDENSDFRLLKDLRTTVSEALNIKEEEIELSMGMSSDYKLAIEYGSTNLRVGSTIFGSRYYPDRA